MPQGRSRNARVWTGLIIALALGATVALMLSTSACSDSDADSARDIGAPSGSFAGMDAPPTEAAGTGGARGSDDGQESDPPPDEVERPAAFEQPAAGARYVYIANTTGNSVAVVDSQTRNIEVVPAGDEPTFVQTLGGRDVAVVLNASVLGTPDANILRTGPEGTSTGIVPVAPGANAIAVAPDGAHAIAYHDTRLRRAGMASGSFQDVTLISFDEEEDRSTDVTVGFRPQSVTFVDDNERAMVVTEDGVSVIDFAAIESSGPTTAPPIPLGDPAAPPFTDVSITADGAYALARREDESLLRLVALDSGDALDLDVAGLFAPFTDADGDAGADEPLATVTDVDLSPGGGFALACVRARNRVLQIPIPQGFESPESIESMAIDGVIPGSVTIAPSGELALAYSTTANDERIVLLDLTGAEAPSAVRLRKGVSAVAIAPDNGTALVIHSKLPGSPDEPGLDTDTVIDRSDGYTVLDLRTGFAKLQLSSAPLGPFAITPTGSHLFVLFNEAGADEVHRVDLSAFRVYRQAMNSPPTSVGVVPESDQVFVGQDHPSGRITFFEWESGAYQTVTGFEGSSRIRNR